MSFRPAQVGDQGIVLGQESYGSIAALVLQVGEPVEVVEGEASSYGAHNIVPWDAVPSLNPAVPLCCPPKVRTLATLLLCPTHSPQP